MSSAFDYRDTLADAKLGYLRQCGHRLGVECPQAFKRVAAEFLKDSPYRFRS